MTLDVSPSRPVRVPMFVLGLLLVAGASWGGAYMALKGEISSLSAGQAQDRLTRAEAKIAYDEFRVDVQTRIGTLERSDLQQSGDIKRMQQDQAALITKADTTNNTLEEVRRMLAEMRVIVENIRTASTTRLPGDPPPRPRR